MLRNTATLAIAIAILTASGCASIPARDPALDDARLSVDAARRNPQVSTYAAAEFDQASATLRQADALAAGGGRYDEVHQLALLANQRAANAQDVARFRSEQAALVAQRTAIDARIQADASQRQATAAQVQAMEAQRQADQAQRLAAVTPAAYDYRRRDNEPLYDATVTSARAIVGPAQQRCWVERQVVGTGNPGINVPGAVVGGVIGGILGHQVGSGRGQDWATGIGAAGGAVVGANVGRDNGPVYTQDVQRCASVTNAAPDYWDITYTFRGYGHRMQTTTPPGSTILVNSQGEPRI